MGQWICAFFNLMNVLNCLQSKFHQYTLQSIIYEGSYWLTDSFILCRWLYFYVCWNICIFNNLSEIILYTCFHFDFFKLWVRWIIFPISHLQVIYTLLVCLCTLLILTLGCHFLLGKTWMVPSVILNLALLLSNVL